MTALSLYVYSTDEDESKGIIVHGNLLQSCSTDEDESKGIIVNKTLLQSCSTYEDELCSTEEDKLECTIKKQEDTKNEVTYDVPNYFKTFNVSECGRKLSYRLGLSYKRVCIATPKEKYFTEMLTHPIEHNHRHVTPMSN